MRWYRLTQCVHTCARTTRAPRYARACDVPRRYARALGLARSAMQNSGLSANACARDERTRVRDALCPVKLLQSRLGYLGIKNASRALRRKPRASERVSI